MEVMLASVLELGTELDATTEDAEIAWCVRLADEEVWLASKEVKLDSGEMEVASEVIELKLSVELPSAPLPEGLEFNELDGDGDDDMDAGSDDCVEVLEDSTDADARLPDWP